MSEKKCNNCEIKGTEHSLGWEILKELTKIVKRSYILVVAVLVLWFATIGVFTWYINHYNHSNCENYNKTSNTTINTMELVT